MEIDYRLVNLGWADVTVSTSEEDEVTVRVSYLSDALGDLIRTTTDVLRGQQDVACSWLQEPGEIRWIFRREGRVVNLAIVDAYEHPPTMLLGTTLDGTELGRAVVSAADRVRAQVGNEGYKERWRFDFPDADLEALRASVKTAGA